MCIYSIRLKFTNVEVKERHIYKHRRPTIRGGSLINQAVACNCKHPYGICNPLSYDDLIMGHD